MSSLESRSPELADADLADLLGSLARRGAAVLIEPVPGGLAWLCATEKGSLVCRSLLDDAQVYAAIARGLIDQRADADGWRLTPAGRAVLRRARGERTLLRATASPVGSAAIAAGSPPRPALNERESPLAWLRRRTGGAGEPLIGAEQFEAGERLRADLWRARMTPRVTASWDGIPQARRQRRGAPGAYVEASDGTIAARERVIRALVAVGPEHIDLLIDVLGHLKGLEEIERTARLPPRSAKRFLQRALTALARHYGLLPATDVEKDVRARLRHWGADDYRPASTRHG